MVPELIQRIHDSFRKGGLTLSVAESCTGGLICHYLTAIPGASDLLLAGVVVYSVEAKKGILGVSPETISRFGVVSAEMAGEMAERVREITRSDYSLSTTGNLGPGVMEGKEKGLVYLAVSGRDRTETLMLRLKGEREENKEQASLSALAFLLETVQRDRGEI